METARRRGPLPIFPPSGFSIHQELFPVPSFCTRMKRVCKERLCLIEFFQPAELLLSPLSLKYGTNRTIQSYICDKVSLFSGVLSMARVIRSAYDWLPHAFRLDDLDLRSCPATSSAAPDMQAGAAAIGAGAPAGCLNSVGAPPLRHAGTLRGSTFTDATGNARFSSSGHGSGQVHDLGRQCGS